MKKIKSNQKLQRLYFATNGQPYSGEVCSNFVILFLLVMCFTANIYLKILFK